MTFMAPGPEVADRPYHRSRAFPFSCRWKGGFLLLALAPALKAGTEADTIAIRARTAVFRSALLPGWGQWTNGKRFKAVLVFGAEAGLIVNAVIQNQKARSAETEAARSFYANNRGLSIWWAAGVYLLNLLDAYVDAELTDFDVGPELGFTRTGPMLGMRFLIPLDRR